MATPTLIQLYNFYADQKWWDGPFKYVVCTTWTRKKNLLNLRLTYNMVLLYGEWTLQYTMCAGYGSLRAPTGLPRVPWRPYCRRLPHLPGDTNAS
jgi:hypothetical protein